MKNWAKREGSGGEASTSRTRQNKHWVQISSVQFTHSVVSDTLRPHGLQHARLPIPSPTPRAYSNSSPSSWWCHPIFSSSVISFSSCLQSFSASGSLPMSQFFASGGQSFSFSISPSNEYSGPISFRIDKLDLSVQGTGCDRLLSNFFQLYLLFFKIPLDGALFIYSYPYSVQFSSVILD